MAAKNREIQWGKVLVISQRLYDVYIKGYWNDKNFVKGYGTKESLVSYLRATGLMIDDVRAIPS